MPKKNQPAGLLVILLLSIMSLALSVSTVIFGLVPLFLIRRNFGRSAFLITSFFGLVVFAATQQPIWLVVYMASIILTFVFVESENQNFGFTTSMVLAQLFIMGLGSVGVGFLMQRYGVDPSKVIRGFIERGLSTIQLPQGVSIDLETLINQLPSGILIMSIMSLWASFILASRVERVFKWKATHMKNIYRPKNLRNWKLPDSFVWLVLLSAAGSFLQIKWLGMAQWLSINIFNVAVTLYFFQGLAVIVDYFERKKAPSFLKILTYIFMFSPQFFLMVSFLGFVDLWFEFRNKMKTDNPSTVA